ncbi:NUDIX hydrolase [Longibacter salinarum]|uniref:GDP-mannose pyrophosphatase n=1 Tax=Longibacter salinarum TaxID=1850348 RepID=A0A2A8D172_9BACT|nr:NUDIX hydrolase [Longibacter salinarum]PEN14557.1 NUDIX hydrolase [Longibacter salinarum]
MPSTDLHLDSDGTRDLTEEQISSDELVDGVLLNVYRDKVRTPDGESSVREWIDHPGASAIVPVFEDGSTILIRQFRYPARRTFLEVPAGKIDRPDEDPADVAARELEEETGWKADTFDHLASSYPCIGYSNEVIHFFLATGLTRGEQDLSDGEFVDVVQMPIEKAIRLAKNGELRDMKTVTALVYAAARLSED